MFRDWLPIGPGSFSVTPALSLDELRCRCQLFGVFVETRIDIRSPDPAGFDDHLDLLARLDGLADRVVGLQVEDG